MATEKKKTTGVWWWIGWIILTIVSFFAACYLWTPLIAKHVGTMDKPWAPILWITAVFGTWMVLLIPLIVVMYAKVDKAYEDARMSREAAQLKKVALAPNGPRFIFTEPSERALPKPLSDKLKKMPEAIRRGHLVKVTLKDGRQFDNVFIHDKREVLGIYGQTQMPFLTADVSDLEPVDLDKLPRFTQDNWLRLDGAKSD
jgi:hypothetical protein